MSVNFDLSKVQYTSAANSLKNDGQIYTGSITFPTSIPGGSFNATTVVVPLNSTPQFSVLYAYFQEYLDVQEQYFAGPVFNTAQWYQTSINTKIGLIVTAPAPSAGPLDAIIYPVINGNNVTVTGLVNNPYAAAITLTQLTVPFAFVVYGLTN